MKKATMKKLFAKTTTAPVATQPIVKTAADAAKSPLNCCK